MMPETEGSFPAVVIARVAPLPPLWNRKDRLCEQVEEGTIVSALCSPLAAALTTGRAMSHFRLQ